MSRPPGGAPGRRDLSGAAIETTCTGKALVALVADARGGRIDGARVMFIDTYSSPGNFRPRRSCMVAKGRGDVDRARATPARARCPGILSWRRR